MLFIIGGKPKGDFFPGLHWGYCPRPPL